MILTDREIQATCEHGQIVIVPEPDFSVALSSTSLDLTLSKHVRLWKDSTAGTEQTICPASNEYSYEVVARDWTVHSEIEEDGYIFKPGQFLLAWTNEEITLPTSSRLAARVEGKSSLARLGIGVHVTAPTIHAGFAGQIQLEMFNHGKHRIKLQSGMRVCQLIFEQTMGTPDKGYKGKFLHQAAVPVDNPE